MSARGVMDSLRILSPFLIHFPFMACQKLQWRVQLNSSLPSGPWWAIPRSCPITHLNGHWWIPPIDETHWSDLIWSTNGILILGWSLIPNCRLLSFDEKYLLNVINCWCCETVTLSDQCCKFTSIFTPFTPRKNLFRQAVCLLLALSLLLYFFLFVSFWLLFFHQIH